MPESRNPARVLIVDDDELARRALVSYFSGASDLRVVGVCGDGGEAVARMTSEIDIVLMDVRMPSVDGVEATRSILQRFPTARILMLTSFDDDTALVRALQAGAHGFLLKNSSPEAIIEAVRAAHLDVGQISPTMLAKLAKPPVGGDAAAVLTDREREVLRLLCAGHSNREIATAMYLSNTTVKGHLASLGRKLGGATRLQIVLRAHDLGIDRAD